MCTSKRAYADAAASLISARREPYMVHKEREMCVLAGMQDELFRLKILTYLGYNRPGLFSQQYRFR